MKRPCWDSLWPPMAREKDPFGHVDRFRLHPYQDDEEEEGKSVVM